MHELLGSSLQLERNRRLAAERVRLPFTVRAALQRLQRVFGTSVFLGLREEHDFGASIAIEVGEFESDGVRFDGKRLGKCEPAVVESAQPERLLGTAVNHDFRLAVTIEVGRANLIHTAEAGKWRAKIEATARTLSEDQHARGIGIRDGEVNESVSIEIGSRQIAVSARTLLAEAELNESFGQIVFSGLPAFDVQQLDPSRA